MTALTEHYDVDVIVDGDSTANKTLGWFKQNGDIYDRILYHAGDNHHNQEALALLPLYPGVVVLHDFYLSNLTKFSYLTELYHSHGYVAVKKYYSENSDREKYPCNLRLIQQSIGVITCSSELSELARSWYGEECADKFWSVDKNVMTCGAQLYNQLEDIYLSSANQIPSLIKRLSFEFSDWLTPYHCDKVASAIDQSIAPEPQKKQMLVDISELVSRDAKTGIQRVVRSILMRLLLDPPPNYRVEPVYATETEGYCYARQFVVNFLDCPYEELVDDPISFYAGDIFFGLDFSPSVVPIHHEFYQVMRQQGVTVKFVVYDILCVTMPQYFSEAAQLSFVKWINTVTDSDGVICISKSSKDEFNAWVIDNAPDKLSTLSLDWFHLGADVEQSKPTYGLPQYADSVIFTLKSKPSFLMVGTIEPRKGYAEVLDAFDCLWAQGSELVLVMVGKQGWMVEALISKIQNHPLLNQQLFWLDAISDEFLEKAYTHADCLLAASYGEGFGLPLIEACRHQLPIMARDIPVFHELAAEYAYFFNVKDARELSSNIRQWLALYEAKNHPESANMPWLTWKQSADQLLQKLLPQASGALGETIVDKNTMEQAMNSKDRV